MREGAYQKGYGAAIQEHIHTGPVNFVVAGISAVIFIQLLRLASAWLVTKPQGETAGKVLASIIQTD